MESNTPQRKIILVVVLVIIVSIIGYLEYKKSGDRISVKGGSADIPFLVGGNQGQVCENGYCTTTPAVSGSSTGQITSIASSSIKASVTSGYMSPEEKLKKYPRAKELVSPDGFLNSDPFKIADKIGKEVIIVDFWTYSCINCQRTIPYLNSWYDKYHSKGLEIVGVHTPEFDFEKIYANVAAAIKKYNIKYPVVQDNKFGTWNAYENRYWPRKYIIDIDGFIVYDHIGEGGYEETEQKIQYLLNEKAAREGSKEKIAGPLTSFTSGGTRAIQISPETYFGSARNEFLANGQSGFSGEQKLEYDPATLSKASASNLFLSGTWNFSSQYAENSTAGSIGFTPIAKKVFMVAESASPIDVQIYLDGTLVRTVTIKNAELYTLVNEGKGTSKQTLEIKIPKAGLKAYTFTFE